MAQSTSGTAKRGPGRPFEKGDARINRGGRRPHILTAALTEALTPARATQIVEQMLALAEAGESWAVQIVWDRLEGKAIARTESREPGDFTGLEGIATFELLKLVKKPS
jgi:hypothetical protein